MVAACCAEGVTVIEGVGELRVKETDRLRSMQQGLERMGATVQCLEPQTVQVIGTRLRGALVESLGDHRTAMALTVAGLLAEGTTRVKGVECVEKSFREFFDTLKSITPSGTLTLVPT
jgi:3-phosphoshikimate 1-carboxyvinyltransferase